MWIPKDVARGPWASNFPFQDIEGVRKALRVTDPQAREKVACECFRVFRDEYARLRAPVFTT